LKSNIEMWAPGNRIVRNNARREAAIDYSEYNLFELGIDGGVYRLRWCLRNVLLLEWQIQQMGIEYRKMSCH